MGQETNLSSTWSPSGLFTDSPYLVSLRGKDPKRTSTVTMHVSQSFDSSSRCPGVKSHHFGPGMKVTGGQLAYANEDRREGRIPMAKCLDPADILKHYQRKDNPSQLGESGALRTRNNTMPKLNASSSSEKGSKMGSTTKVIYFDGKQHHILDREEGQAEEWHPPHLTHKDLVPGPLLAVKETGGAAGTALIASKYRALVSAPASSNNYSWQGPIPPPYGATKSRYGLHPYAPVQITKSFGNSGQIDVDTLRTYAKDKLMGHREYEATVKNMEGMQAWRSSQCDMTTSMSIGHSTRLLSAKEHMLTRLSLRH